jgi:hypothetical protein
VPESLALVWAHGILAGIDTPAIVAMYVLTGGAVVGLAVSRYVSTTHRDEAEDLGSVAATELRGAHRVPLGGRRAARAAR